MYLAVNPVLLGAGEPPFAGLDLPALGYKTTEYVATGKAAHDVIARA